MNKEQFNTLLYEKVFAQQKQFREWLMARPPNEILNHAYESVMREDILLSLESNDLTANQAKAPLCSPAPLDDLFREWEKRETGHMADIWATVEERADALLQRQKEAAHQEAR